MLMMRWSQRPPQDDYADDEVVSETTSRCAVTFTAITLAAVTPAAASLAAVTPAAVTPAAVTPGAVTLAAFETYKLHLWWRLRLISCTNGGV